MNGKVSVIKAEWQKRFHAWCEEYRFFHGVLYSEKAKEKGLVYLQLLRKWNDSLALVGPKELDVFWERHWLDSIKAVFFLNGPHLIDFGSGAGFPGLPIAIYMQKFQLICVERVAKKRAFLMEAIGQLDLGERVQVLESLEEAVQAVPIKNSIELVVRGVSTSDMEGELLKLDQPKRGLEILYWGLDGVFENNSLPKWCSRVEKFSKGEPFNLSFTKMFHVEHF